MFRTAIGFLLNSSIMEELSGLVKGIVGVKKLLRTSHLIEAALTSVRESIPPNVALLLAARSNPYAIA